MKNDLFIRTLLIIIVTLLALNIILPILSNPPTSYAAKNIEYKVIHINDIKYFLPSGEKSLTSENVAEATEKLLKEYGKEGWEYIENGPSGCLIFKR